MKHSLALPAISMAVAALLGTAASAWGQASAPTPSSSASSPSSASERASREGDKVFKWILMHSDKPRKAPAVKEVTVREAKAEAPKPPVARTEKTVAPPSVPPQGTAAARTPELPKPAEAVAALAPPSARQEKPAEPAPEEDTDEPLLLKTQVDPEFPGALMRNLRKGTVQVKFTVQPDGTVGNTEVVKTTHSRLNTAAMAAVKQWRFEPVRHAQLGIVELGFNLD
jgi:TonB family protein